MSTVSMVPLRELPLSENSLASSLKFIELISSSSICGVGAITADVNAGVGVCTVAGVGAVALLLPFDFDFADFTVDLSLRSCMLTRKEAAL